MVLFYLTIAMACFMTALAKPVHVPRHPVASKRVSNSTKKLFLPAGIRQDVTPPHVPCDINELKNAFPSIDYTFAGYDVVEGYPLSKGRDPGFRAPIFRADYARGKPNGDCRYMLPKGIIAVPDVSCDISFKSDVVHSAAEFHNSLSASANIEGGGWGFEFSASASYQKSNSDISSREYVYVISRAKCTSYFSRIEVQSPPPFDEGFLAKARELAEVQGSATTEVENKFIETFGTHFLDEVTFGSSYTHEHRMSSGTYQTLSSSSFGVSVQASYSGLFSVGGGFSLDSEQQQAASTFSKSVETSTITVGSAPPSDGDAMTWAASSRENPVPVAYRLRPIADLFTRRFFTSSSGLDYENVFTKLQNAAQKSCQIHRANGVAVSCVTPRNYGAAEVITINGGYPRMPTGESEFLNSFYLTESQPNCELMCSFDKACIGYTSPSGPGGGSCQVAKEGSEYQWVNDNARSFTMYFNKMVDDLLLNVSVPKVVDTAADNRIRYAYYKILDADKEFSENVQECRGLCVLDPKCKAFRFGKCHDSGGLCINRNCYIFHDISSLSAEELTDTVFYFVAK